MGDNPKTSVLNNWKQSHDIKNLFVVDGSAFVTCGWQNPTMTISALSMRASENLEELMKQGALYLTLYQAAALVCCGCGVCWCPLRKAEIA